MGILSGVAKAGLGTAKLTGKAGLATGKVVGKPVAKHVASGTPLGIVTGKPMSRKAQEQYTKVREKRDQIGEKSKGKGLSQLNKKKNPMGNNIRKNVKTAALEIDEDGRKRLHNLYGDMLTMHKEAMVGTIAAGAIGAGLGHAAIQGGIHGAQHLYKNRKTEKVWDKLKQSHPKLTKSKQDRENFEVLQQFAPDLASNPTVARSYLERAKMTNMTPHEFVQDLANTQSTIQQGQVGKAMSGAGQHALRDGMTGAKLKMDKKSSLNKSTLQMKLDQLDPR